MSNRIEHEITPELLLAAYAIGIFPMADSADDPSLFWVEPEQRGIFPLDGMVISRSLAKALRADPFEIRVDHDPDAIIARCARATPSRPRTWISLRLRDLYRGLWRDGHLHSVEAWREGALAGGLYGVALGGAFFGESMFHSEPDASKVCLMHLAARLRVGGFGLLDTQFVTPHLASLGAIEISRARYRRLVRRAVTARADFRAAPAMSGKRVLESLGRA
jgi:leucyl/phenylalanyl-tRNA--protein transferase